VENGNRAPVLEAISNQTVSLGGSLNFTTTAIDSDGDDLSFFVNTLPLPAGATFDATSGQFSFAPRSASPQQVTLAFGVTDGELTDSQSVTFTVTTNPDFTSTSFTGRVIDSETGEPLTGVSVEVGNITVTTNSNGVFTASGLTSGVVEICIETDGAINGQSYGAVHFTTNLIEGVLNQHQGDIALSRALVSGQFEEGEDIILQNNAAGVRFEAGADSLFNNVQPSRFWRLLFNSSAQPDQANAVVAFAELTFESRSDNTNIATNLREISASSSFGGSNKPEVNLVTITARGDGFGPIQAPRDFEIQISEDGQAWTTIQTIVGETDWRASETRSFTVGGEFEGSISLVETQAENIAVTPPTGNTCAYYSINTKSAFFASDVSLTIPNRDEYLENTPLDIFASFDGAFRKIGDTRVGSNSSSITAEISSQQFLGRIQSTSFIILNLRTRKFSYQQILQFRLILQSRKAYLCRVKSQGLILVKSLFQRQSRKPFLRPWKKLSDKPYHIRHQRLKLVLTPTRSRSRVIMSVRVQIVTLQDE